MSASPTLAVWTERVKSLEGALARRGRADLVPALDLLLRVLAVSEAEAHHDAIQSLVARVLTEVKVCISDPTCAVSASLFGEMDDLLAQEESDSKDWASDLLAGLGSADDSQLDALASAVRALEPMAPKDELGTLREPLNRAAQAAGAAPPRVLMKGELHPGLLADLIQLFAQNAETGLLLIEGGGTSAKIFFKTGVITDAICDGDLGEKGFFRAMQVREGRFSYQRGIEAETVRIYRTAQHLIMDTLRMMDEAS
jgi:hypothetical protein